MKSTNQSIELDIYDAITEDKTDRGIDGAVVYKVKIPEYTAEQMVVDGSRFCDEDGKLVKVKESHDINGLYTSLPWDCCQCEINNLISSSEPFELVFVGRTSDIA